MTDPDTNPIVVNPDQTMAQLGVAIRYALTAVGGYMVAKGWLEDDLLQIIVNVAVMLGPIAYAAWRSQQQKRALVKIAEYAPNDVAVVKGKVA